MTSRCHLCEARDNNEFERRYRAFGELMSYSQTPVASASNSLCRRSTHRFEAIEKPGLTRAKFLKRYERRKKEIREKSRTGAENRLYDVRKRTQKVSARSPPSNVIYRRPPETSNLRVFLQPRLNKTAPR